MEVKNQCLKNGMLIEKPEVFGRLRDGHLKGQVVVFPTQIHLEIKMN